MKQENIRKGHVVHGFIVKRVVLLKNIRSIFYELEHEKSGAPYIHIANDDTENGFCVAFKTIPEDSTGVPHILEHTVLTGSRKYPVRDPFFSMTRRSLKTFMNAMTSTDCTFYPFATQNEKDYYNLLDVYMDAGFFSEISELNFRQEGHRVEFNKKNGKLEFKGVVYNEMKGAMSSVDRIIFEDIRSTLLPSGPYAYNSGGDPEFIPDLTYEQLKNFYKRFYHPSNSYFFTYGNFPLLKRLEVINGFLKEFDRIDPCTNVPFEERWVKSKEVEISYPLGKKDDPAKKYMAGFGWLTSRIDEPFEVFSLDFLGRVLLKNSESPLCKKLIDSGLGTSLLGHGFSSNYNDCTFVCGLKGIRKEDASKVKKIIMDVFSDLVREGIDRDLIKGIFNTFEINQREISRGGGYPYFLTLFSKFNKGWIHGADPLKYLDSEKYLKMLREKIDDNFLEQLIEKYFLNNPHQVSLLFSPDQEMNELAERREKEKLEKIESSLTGHEKEQIIKLAHDLEKLQDSPEDLSVLPTLDLSDISLFVKTSKGVALREDRSIIRYKKDTNGLCYVKFVLDFDIDRIDPDVLPLLPLFCNCFTSLGTKRHSRKEMANLISMYTGGMIASYDISRKFTDIEQFVTSFEIIFDCLSVTKEKAFEIVEELMTEYSFDDLEKIKSLILLRKDKFEAAVVNSGHGFAEALACRGFDRKSEIDEILTGVHQLKFLQKLTRDLDEEKLKSISEKLKSLAKVLINNHKMSVALVADSDRDIQELSALSLFLKNNISKIEPVHVDSKKFLKNNVRECWTTTTNVSFVADCFRVADKSHEDAVVLDVAAKVLKACFIHKEIREKGGAYGGYAVYDRHEGIFSFMSYRDPNISRTIDTFRRGVYKYIAFDEFSETNVKEAILEVFSSLDTPLAPYQEALRDFNQRRMGYTNDQIMLYKERLLKVTKEDVIRVLDKYFIELGLHKRSLVVISSTKKIQTENEKMSIPLEVKII